jgi:succinoglycan biosynthesis protein ExoO
MKEPAVSVIMPCRDARHCIGRAIASVFAQTMRDFELIVVDDASRDGTAAFVAECFGNDPRVRLVRQATNEGPAACRNAALAMAQGTWIALLDADDAWEPWRLERLLEQSGDLDAIFDTLVAYDAVSQKITGPLFPAVPQGEVTVPLLLDGAATEGDYDLGYLKPMLRREFLRRHGLAYREHLRTGEDLVFYLELLLRRPRTRLVDTRGYIYTTPVGHASGQVSSHSHTQPRDDELRRELGSICAEAGARMTPLERQALADRMEALRKIAAVAMFYHARRTKNYRRACALAATRWSVQRELVGKLADRLGRALRPSPAAGQKPSVRRS